VAITTLAELQDAVHNWLVRTDQSARTPEFIALAEAEINRRLEIREMETRSTATLTTNTQYIELPTTAASFLRLERLKITTDPQVVLRYLPPHQLDFEFPSATTGKPQAYSLVGTSIQLRPIADATYTLESVYYARLSALSASNVPTLFTQNPDLYLYGALAHAMLFINEPDETQRHSQFRGLFDKALAEQRLRDMKGRYSGSPLVIRSDVGAP